MCKDDVACGPCSEKATPCAVKQADAPLIVWGPISDEVPSRDNPPKLVRLEAVEEAIPQILARGVVDVKHDSAFIVAKLHALAKVDLGRVPPAHQRMVQEVVATYGGLPTGMVRVTEAIAAVFPRIKHRIGERLGFAASQLLDDNRTTARARQDILEGRLDSYSIAGASYGSRFAKHCDPNGCQVVQEIPSMDGSALTFTSYERQRSLAGESRAANPAAGFVVVQQTTSLPVETSFMASEGGGAVADAPAAAPETPAPSQEAPAAVVPPTPDVPVPAPPQAAESVPAVLITIPAAPEAAPEAVKQADEKPAEQPSAAEKPKTDVDAVIAQLVKRLTDLEVEVALLKGRKEEAPAPEPAKEAEKAPEKDEAPKKDGSALKQVVPEPAAEVAASTPTPSSPGLPDTSEVKAILQDMDNGDPSALKRLRHTYGGRKA